MAAHHSNVYIYNCTFNNNSDSVIFLLNHTNGTMKESRFYNNSHNSEDSAGAVVLIIQCFLNLSNTIFHNNSATIFGLASAFIFSGLSVFNCTYTNNTGSAIFLQRSSNVTVNYSNFSNGSDSNGGKALLFVAVRSTLKVFNSNFHQNSYLLGTISLANCNASVHNSTFIMNSSPVRGGAIEATNSTLYVLNSTFHKNSAVFGGAIGISGCQFLIRNCSLYGNRAIKLQGLNGLILQDKIKDQTGWGGAISAHNAQGTIKESLFENNSASFTGGALAVSLESTITVSDVDFVNNKAVFYGGALSIVAVPVDKVMDGLKNILKNMKDSSFVNLAESKPYGALQISETSFIQNQAYQGGALFVTFYNATIYNSLFDSNTGSAVFCINSTLHVDGTTFLNNSSPQEGGALLGGYSMINLRNGILEQNTAAEGGAIYLRVVNEAIFSNCSFTNNSGSNEGGALVITDGNAHIAHSTFLDNTAKKGGVLYLEGSLHQSECLLEGNHAEDGGCFYMDQGSELTVIHSNFSDNFARDSGGIMHTKKSSVHLVNISVENTTVGEKGGVIRVELSSIINIRDSKFLRNGGKDVSGGIIHAGKNATVFVNNSIVRNNYAFECGAFYIDTSSSLELNHSWIEGNAADYAIIGIRNNSLFIGINCAFRQNSVFFSS